MNPPDSPNGMLIAHVTPYPPTRNGIGDYTIDLCSALSARSDVTTIVLGDKVDGAPEEEPGVKRCWDPTHKRWDRELLEAIETLRPDVVHIQHGFHFGFGAPMIGLLEGLRRLQIASVVTLHGVWGGSIVQPGPQRLHTALADHCDRTIIHQRAGSEDILTRHGVPPERVELIPHGTYTDAAQDREEAKAALGLPTDRKVVLFLGLIYPRKGLHVLVSAFNQIAADVPDALLLVAGRQRKSNPVDQAYLYMLHRRMRRGLEQGWLDLRADHVPEELLTTYMSAADLIVFPYNRAQGSSSGVFHRALAAERAVLCTRCHTFGEAQEAWGDELPEAFAKPGDVASMATSLKALLSDDELRGRVTKAVTTLKHETSWPAIAERHESIYRRIVQ